MPFFDDIMKMLHTEGPLNWDLARQFAQWAVTEGQPEANVDPVQRIRMGELLRVAELHVGDATGLPTSLTGGLLTVRPVTKGEWARIALDDWTPLLEGLAETLGTTKKPGGLGPSGSDELAERGEPGGPGGPGEAGEAEMAGFLGELTSFIGPLFMSIQIGGMAGHLAQRALDRYDPPLPRPASDELLVVPATIDAFAADWSLPVDDVRLWVLIHELTHHVVLGRPHVHERLHSLLLEYVTGFDPDPRALEDKLEAFDPMHPESLPEIFGDPEALIGEVQTQAQRDALAKIDALMAAVFGYVDHVMDAVGRKLIGSYGPLTEALRRRRVEEDDASRMLGRLLGLEMRQSQFDRGTAFVKGVLERAGEDGLSRLWRSEKELPTTAEIDAPGLWLARIDLPD